MDRIEHVVVVMLENRSFDHLLGFLDHPTHRFPEFDPKDFGNPVNPVARPPDLVYATPNADFGLETDPPHSHKGVMEQLALNPRGKARMTGFVSSYTRKAMGKEERPIIHWTRIYGVVSALSLAVAWYVSRRATMSGRASWILALASEIVVAVALLLLRRKVNSPENRKLTEEQIAAAEATGRKIMQCMDPSRIPVVAELARKFAICTRWFSSVPGETWPNRNFLHAGTSDGTVEIEIGFYDDPTIFECLEAAERTWGIYCDGGIPHSWIFKNLWNSRQRIANWKTISELASDAASGKLPTYAFVEPRHQSPGSNSQHPGNNRKDLAPGESDFERGEELVARVYEALRAEPSIFEKTLLVVTYDEHGGFFDHFPPPDDARAPTPLGDKDFSRSLVAFFIERRRQNFDFRRLGVRVPTVIVSPRIPEGCVDETVYDHTSVIATLRSLFIPGLTRLRERDEFAKTFEGLATFDVPPRSGDQLPDLSAYVRRAPAVAAAADADVGPDIDSEEFGRQLRQLAAIVRSELPPPGPVPIAAAEPEDPRIAADPDGDVIAGFFGLASLARERR